MNVILQVPVLEALRANHRTIGFLMTAVFVLGLVFSGPLLDLGHRLYRRWGWDKLADYFCVKHRRGWLLFCRIVIALLAIAGVWIMID